MGKTLNHALKVAFWACIDMLRTPSSLVCVPKLATPPNQPLVVTAGFMLNVSFGDIV